MKRLIQKQSLLAALCLISILTISVAVCKNSNHRRAITSTGTCPVSGNMACARVIHAIPCAPPVDVYINGMLIIRNLAYSQATDYTVFKPDQYWLTVFPAGTTVNPFIDTLIDLRSKHCFSIVAAGMPDIVTPLILEDYSGRPSRENAFVRFVHLVPDGPAFNIRMDCDKIRIATGLMFADATGYIKIPPGNYNITVRETDQPSVLMLEVPSIALEAGRVYSIDLEGITANNCITAVPYIDK